MNRARAGATPGAGGNRARLPAPTSTSRDSRSGWAIAKRAATDAPSEAPTSAGGAGQVRSISASSQASTRAASGGPSPPSSTAVDTPARSSRRSVTGAPASIRRRASSAAA
jgi:hypothetical protein